VIKNVDYFSPASFYFFPDSPTQFPQSRHHIPLAMSLNESVRPPSLSIDFDLFPAERKAAFELSRPRNKSGHERRAGNWWRPRLFISAGVLGMAPLRSRRVVIARARGASARLKTPTSLFYSLLLPPTIPTGSDPEERGSDIEADSVVERRSRTSRQDLALSQSPHALLPRSDIQRNSFLPSSPLRFRVPVRNLSMPESLSGTVFHITR